MFAEIAQPGLYSTIEHISLVASVCCNVALAITAFKKVDVRLIDAMATEKDCRERHELATKAVAELHRIREDDNRASSISRKAIYEKIEQSKTETAGKIEDVRKELSEQITDMPSQIIMTLRNFGIIGGNKQ